MSQLRHHALVLKPIDGFLHAQYWAVTAMAPVSPFNEIVS